MNIRCVYVYVGCVVCFLFIEPAERRRGVVCAVAKATPNIDSQTSSSSSSQNMTCVVVKD